MKKLFRYGGMAAAFAMMVATNAAAQAGQPNAGSRISDLIIYDSLTPAKKQLRNFVGELRDSLVRVESVQARIVRARASKMTGVIVSQGRELARICTIGASMVGLTTKRIEPMITQDPQGNQAMQAYRSALTSLQQEMHLCAHFDSLAMVAKPLDDQKLENIATAARESISRYDVIRDGLMKLLGITLPIKGSVGHR